MSSGMAAESLEISAGLSRIAFVKKLGISSATLCDIEKGRRPATIKRAVKIAKRLVGHINSVTKKDEFNISEHEQEQDMIGKYCRLYMIDGSLECKGTSRSMGNLNLKLLFLSLTVAHYPSFAEPHLSTSPPERILMVTTEHTGIHNTGGLGHTISSLSGALNKAGVTTEVVMPYFEGMPEHIKNQIKYEHVEMKTSNSGLHETHFGIYSITNPENGVKTYLLRHHLLHGQTPHFVRTGKGGYFDPARLATRRGEAEAWINFADAIAQFTLRHHEYTIINFHDWQAGLAISELKTLQKTVTHLKNVRTLFTISNMAYQGRFGKDELRGLATLSAEPSIRAAEFHGDINFLKAGLESADVSMTVSPNYATELESPRFSLGLEGKIKKLKQKNRFFSILNGADLKKWNPEHPGFQSVKYAFSARDFSGKSIGKSTLQAELGFAVDPKVPVVALTSRIADQKGWSYLIGSLTDVLESENIQLVIVGDGEERYLSKIRELEQRFPNKVKLQAFSSALEAKATYYSDFFLNAPWYEPSGTNQLFAMAVGTPPISTRTGGLANYIKDRETGFLADIYLLPDGITTDIPRTRESVTHSIKEALNLYHHEPEKLLEMKIKTMLQDNSWNPRIHEYLDLFSYLKNQGWKQPTPRCLDFIRSIFPNNS